MKKIYGILILILVMSLSACNKMEQGSSNENTKTNEGCIDDYTTIIGTLNEELKGINDKKLDHDVRVETTTRFIEDLTKLLRTKESTKLSDEDLQKELDNNIVAKSNVQNIDGLSVRIVRFDGLSELFGTLERKWTFIQWWNDMGVHSQIIISKGAEVTDDFLITKVKDIPTIIMAGYQTIYKPYPVFILTWQLKDGEWKEDNLFSDNIVSTDIWNIRVIENIMTIESNDKDELTVELNQQKNGFNVYSEVDQNKQLEFKLQVEQIVVQ